MHYGTFQHLTGTPEQLEGLGGSGIKKLQEAAGREDPKLVNPAGPSFVTGCSLILAAPDFKKLRKNACC